MRPGSISGYQHDKAIGHFYNRDAENAVGFEMRMTHPEYDALHRFIEKLCKDVAEHAREELAANVRRALPTPAGRQP
jgi:hypothetical protein